MQPIRVCLERNAQSFKGSVQVAGRKKPLPHLVGLSEELANTNVSASSGRNVLAARTAGSYGPLWLTSTESQECRNGRTGLPVNSSRGKAIVRALGIGCNPLLVKGEKEQFLDWLSWR